MTQDNDDLEAVRSIAETLEPFDPLDRERILRWVRERLGMVVSATTSGNNPQFQPPPAPPAAQDIRSFIRSKAPENDAQLAATVAYYYRFVAPEGERKDSIKGRDLVEACRLAERRRPARASQTLINAARSGLLDNTKGGGYKINSVGENLVAVVLAGNNASDGPSAVRKKTPKRAAKKKSAGRSNRT